MSSVALPPPPPQVFPDNARGGSGDPGQEIPRPEYPRPQFVREEWLNLNGAWEFRLDGDNVGLEQSWFAEKEFPGRILVPFSIESSRSGIGDRSFHPCVWYRRMFQAPASWRGKRVFLHFGAVDYKSTVWVNGIPVTWHEGGHTPFHCDITGVLKDGENVVVVRAEDPPTDRYIPRGKQYWEQDPVSIYYARTTGIWQTVWLEPVPESYLENVRITPRVDGSVRFESKIVNPSPSQFVSVTIRMDGAVCATAMSLADGPRASVDARVPEPRLWSPDSPHLYDVRIELHGPEGFLDAAGSYFGFRSIATRDGKILFNGQPIYLKTVLDQGYWPESNLTPPSDEAIQ